MDLAASIAVSNRNNAWVNDNMVSTCYNCSVSFGFLTRKHHCRNCGNIFCHSCSNYYVVIPKFITDKPEPEDYWNISYYIPALKHDKERVCRNCYDTIQTRMISYDQIQAILNNPITVDQVQSRVMSIDVRKHYFEHLRNIQYYLPNHRYSETDKNLLKINAHYFATHSKYLVSLIKSIDWRSDNQTTLISSILNSDRVKECSDLMCTRTCQEQLSFDDSLTVLFSTHKDLPDSLIRYFFKIIDETPDIIIQCHIAALADICAHSCRDTVHQSLYKIVSRSLTLMYHMYWFLIHDRTEETLANVDKFLSLYDKSLLATLHTEYDFFTQLIHNLDNPQQYLAARLIQPITVPYDPQWQIISADIYNISVKDSCTKPVLIPFTIRRNEETRTVRLLFKRESVMNDVMVLNLMTLMDILLKENIDEAFDVVVYPTLPLSKNSGMIQIVDKAETVHDINIRGQSILQHILHKNENKVVANVLDRYMYGLASYTLHSYFLGLGDRHLQNIMIHDDGMIFHIDFGYILGADVYPLTSTDIKLCSGMLDVIGGSDSSRRQRYLDLCTKGIVVLRKYFNIFYILLAKTNAPRKLDTYIINRFQPRQSDKIVTNELLTIISHSNNAYAGYIRDFIHLHSQQRTVQNGLAYTLGTAYQLVANLADRQRFS